MRFLHQCLHVFTRAVCSDEINGAKKAATESKCQIVISLTLALGGATGQWMKEVSKLVETLFYRDRA